MFSSAVSQVRSSFALIALAAAAPFLAAQEAAHPASSPSQPAELRVFDQSLIDKSIDPCDNFYRFSCNGWFKRNPLPAHQAF